MDYLDGRVLSRVEVGRDNNPNLVDEDPWSIASDADRAEDEDADRLADPLADPGREPDFVFTLGAGTSDAEPDAASDDIGEYRRTAGAKAYTLEKRRRPIGDAVTDRTQRDPSVAADARAAADAARSAGVVADVHTNITVLFPETFDAATALARRPSDGVGLDRAGGLVGDAETSSDSGSRGSTDGSRKRRWLVAFCARWAPTCNLLVREFALLGSDPALREFALGWVDCTPASMTHFCGARFAVEGYPSVYLITGGRATRYSAADRERLAPAISRWAVDEARRVDLHAPNAGEPAPGIPVPPPTGEREPPEEGRRGARAFSEANELEALRRERERMRAEYAAEEERRARRKKTSAGADAAAEAKRKATRDREEGETTTAPKMSRRRAAREAAKARRANRGGAEL